MIEFYEKKEIGKQIRKISSFSKGSWVKVTKPDESEIDILIKDFGLERNLINDSLDIYENSRIEEESNAIYLFLRAPLYISNTPSQLKQDSTTSFLIVLTKQAVITISKVDLDLFNFIPKFKSFFTNRPARFLIQVLSLTSKSFAQEVGKILKFVKKDRVKLSILGEKDILNLVIQEDILNDYLSSFSPLVGIQSQILKIKSIILNTEEKEFIEDLTIDLNQTLNTCRNALKSISNMRDYYSATITSKLNKTITLLTIFTVFLTVPAVVSGIFGMNILLPLQNNINAFYFIGGFIFVLWIILAFVFKKIIDY